MRRNFSSLPSQIFVAVGLLAAPACLTDSPVDACDCARDERCDEGTCVPIRRGEGEGEGEREGEGEGDTAGDVEDCDDGISNDGDPFVDCDDFDCDDDPACGGGGQVEVCDDGVSNDGDRFVDCDDFDCDGDPACGATGNAEVCDDGVSNDGDRFIDCDDFDCTNDAACPGSPGVDRDRCIGEAHQTRPSTNDTSIAVVDGDTLHLLLADGPRSSFTSGPLYFQIDVPLLPDVLDYPGVPCALVGMEDGALVVKAALISCEVVFEDLTFATSSSSCDGTINGAAIGYDFDLTPYGGGFTTPWNGTRQDFEGNAAACRAPNLGCSVGDECCSGSCSLALGTCN